MGVDVVCRNVSQRHRHRSDAKPISSSPLKKRPETFNRYAGGAHHRHETMPVLRQHQEHPHPPKRSIAGATTHPDSRAATVAPHGLLLLDTVEVQEPRAVRPTRRHRSTPFEANRVARGHRKYPGAGAHRNPSKNAPMSRSPGRVDGYRETLRRRAAKPDAPPTRCPSHRRYEQVRREARNRSQQSPVVMDANAGGSLAFAWGR